MSVRVTLAEKTTRRVIFNQNEITVAYNPQKGGLRRGAITRMICSPKFHIDE